MRFAAWINGRRAARFLAILVAFTPALARGDELNEQTQRKAGWLILRGGAYLQQRNPLKAIDDFSAAIELCPDVSDLYWLRAMAHEMNGAFHLAVADTTKRLELDPAQIVAYVDRGRLKSKLGEYKEALADIDTALAKSPKLASAYYSKAMLLAACPDETFRSGDDAIQCAQFGCDLTQEKWSHLNALAAAYAEHGDWGLAIETETKAAEKAREPYERDECKARLKLYRAKQPYRQTAAVIERDRLATLQQRPRIHFDLKEPKESEVIRR